MLLTREQQLKSSFLGFSNFWTAFVGVVLMVLLSLALSGLASAQESTDTESEASSTGSRHIGEDAMMGVLMLPEKMLEPGFMLGEPIYSGFLFVDGQYVPRPYRVIREGKVIKINGHSLPFDAETHDRRSERRWIQMDQGFSEFSEEWGMGGYRLPSWLRSTEASVERHLMENDVFILIDGDILASAPAVCALPIAEILESPQGDDEKVQALMNLSGRDVFTAVWRQLVETYKPGQGYFEDAQEMDLAWQAMRDEAMRRRDEAMQDPIWLQFLPMLGLIAAVGAIVVVVRTGVSTVLVKGEARNWSHIDDSGQRGRTVMQMVVLLILLNVLDLVFTLSAHTTGEFFEANPITRSMMSSPSVLTLFKVTMVSAGLGVLFVLRHRRAAEVASWWLCVGYTIVALKHVVVSTHIVA